MHELGLPDKRKFQKLTFIDGNYLQESQRLVCGFVWGIGFVKTIIKEVYFETRRLMTIMRTIICLTLVFFV